ncbi:MAG: adenylate/guanylate cyclase domain-containing protein [Lachnospiraceae bacterium]|nr:adenylate/guanylate cyclase domain-containing protein [Lachnospiraceae bacterium]
MKNKTGSLLVTVILAITILLSQYFGLFQRIEYQLQDSRYQTGGLVSPEIYVIGIDEETLMEYGAWQNWGREKMAEMIALLNADEMTAPAVIGVDVGYFGASDPEDDQALAEAASILDNVVMTSYATFGTKIEEQPDGSFTTSEGVQTYEIPYDALAEHVTWGFSNVPMDEDGIVRHSMYKIPMDGDYIYSFAAEVYRKYMGNLPYRVEHGESTGYIPFTGYPYDYYGTATAGISFSRVLNGEIPTEAFTGTIVLIGPYSAGMMDSYYTAIQHDVAMYGVEVHANILQALLEENEKVEVAMSTALLISATMIAFALIGWMTKKVVLAVTVTILAVGSYWFATGIAYENGYILPVFYPVLAAVTVFVSQVAIQYVTESRAKKHIQNVFGRYVSDSVVSSIVKGGEDALKLGGQKKDIAVLFVDVRGFTPLSEGLDPTEVVEILNKYLERTTKAVFDHGGTVDKFIGDATMALFNAPLDLDDYVLNAVRTGLEMAAASNELASEIEAKSGRKVGLGIGINCGEAVVGNIGTSKRMEYTAIGNTVNIAARLEGKAKAGEVIISPYVYERIKDRIEVTSIGFQTLKGISEPVELYRVERVLED